MRDRPLRGPAWGGLVVLATLSLGVAGCSSASRQPDVVTADEARQLNDAAAMLDANSVDADVVTVNESQS